MNQTSRRNLKTKGILLLFCCCIAWILAGCATTEDTVQTEEDFLNHLSKTYKQESFSVTASAEQGKYKLAAFQDNGESIGYALLEKTEKGSYHILKTKMEEDADHLLFQYTDEEGKQLICVVNDGRAKQLAVTADGRFRKRFELDKGTPAAYLFSINGKGAESYTYEFEK